MRKYIETNKFVTMSEIKILLPILITFATVVYGYAQLSAKVDFLVRELQQHIALVDNLEARTGTLEINYRGLQTELSDHLKLK